MPGVRIATVCRQGSDRVVTYQALLEAFQTTMEETDEDVLVMVDGGSPDPRLRSEHRVLKLKHRRIIEDPWPERSQHSQLLQIADLVLHAAYQHIARQPSREFMELVSGAASKRYPVQPGGRMRLRDRLPP